MKKQLLLIMIIVGIVTLVGYNLIIRDRVSFHPPLMIGEGLYQLGDIIVDTIDGEIRFDAKVQKMEGWVQHLIYLHGYRWLKEESAMISEARLADLQKAIALLDWRLWDELWYRKTENREQRTEDRKLLLSIKWDGREIAAQELVLTQDLLGIGDFIFLGSPYFDHIALKAHKDIDCRYCSMFPLKERALRKKFIRSSNQSGYELNSSLFPPKETEMTIIIRGG